MAEMDVSVEVGSRRTFAWAPAWPGWCRSGRGEEAALEALAAYGPRYAASVGVAASGLALPAGPGDLDVVERLDGDASTDFGVPGQVSEADRTALDEAEMARQVALLEGAWAAFDAAAEAARGTSLRTGPRGGGRQVEQIIGHVFDAERAYLRSLGALAHDGELGVGDLRRAILAVLAARARGEEPPPAPRRRKPYWPPRYGIRRIAWHALDHAWEIEDRAPA